MTITRRSLAATALALCTRSAAAALAIRPGDSPTLEVRTGRAVLRQNDLAGEVGVPEAGSRILAVLPLGAREIVVIGFTATLQMGSQGEMAALVGADGARLRILGVELLGWRSAGGASLGTQLSATTDGTRLRLERLAARPRRDLPPLHESWIDYLRWQEGEPLADAPIHKPVPGTCQSALAITRTRVTAALSAPCTSIDQTWLEGAGLLAPPF